MAEKGITTIEVRKKLSIMKYFNLKEHVNRFLFQKVKAITMKDLHTITPEIFPNSPLEKTNILRSTAHTFLLRDNLRRARNEDLFAS